MALTEIGLLKWQTNDSLVSEDCRFFVQLSRRIWGKSIDNIFVKFEGRLFRQVIGIPMGTNCAPLVPDLFLYSYENEFLDNMNYVQKWPQETFQVI